MKREAQGRYVPIATGDESFKAFVPAPLPPHPPIGGPTHAGHADCCLRL